MDNDQPTTTVSLTNVLTTSESHRDFNGSLVTRPFEYRPTTPSYDHTIQNSSVIWLDANIDEINNNDCRSTIDQLKKVFNIVQIFVNVDECIDFITEMLDERIFMIISGLLGSVMVPLIHSIPQIELIYILCMDRERHEQWANSWPKVKGVFMDIQLICIALENDAQMYDRDIDSRDFSIINNNPPVQYSHQLDQSFMYTQILKEILLTIDFNQEHVNNFVTYCRQQFAGDNRELRNIDRFEKEYHPNEAIRWYTSPCFFYSMINRALCTMDIDVIMKISFFISDLHRNITKLHSEQFRYCRDSSPFTVYRGQRLFRWQFNQLTNRQSRLISVNSFLSTTTDSYVAHAFSEQPIETHDIMRVLFKIDIDPSVSSAPFANITECSSIPNEDEVLFSMHSVFRVGQIQQMDDNSCLWQVDLKLTGDNDPQLHALTEYIRKETLPSERGWHRLAILFFKLGHLDKAQDMCRVLLDQSSNECEKANIYFMLAVIKHDQGKYSEAIQFHEEAIKIKERIISPNHPTMAISYSNIAGVFESLGEYSKALSLYKKALEIYQETLPVNHPSLATIYNNIGGLYDSMGQSQQALESLEKALQIKERTLPTNHPNIAVSYNNLGLLLSKMGNYQEALSYYEKAVGIYQKTLPENHRDLAISYNNIGLLYDNMDDYRTALSFYRKALEIRQKIFSSDHPDLANTYNNIGLIYDKIDDCRQALFYHEKAFEIYQKVLPANHPHLAASYNNIAEVYFTMGEYSKAHSFYESALNIAQNSLPAKHPHILIMRKNIEKVTRKL